MRICRMTPTVLNALLQYYDEHKPKSTQAIRVVIAGAAPPPAFITRIEEELGWEFIQVYGMTGSSPLIQVVILLSNFQKQHLVKFKKFSFEIPIGNRREGKVV